MVWIILLLIAGVIIFFFLRDRDKMLDAKVDHHGGMKQKYSVLVEWLTSDPNARIAKVTRDQIQISSVMQSTTTHFIITENFDGVEIVWDAKLGIMGNHRKKWKFPPTTSDNAIIEKIGVDLEEYQRNIF